MGALDADAKVVWNEQGCQAAFSCTAADFDSGHKSLRLEGLGQFSYNDTAFESDAALSELFASEEADVVTDVQCNRNGDCRKVIK